MSKLYGKYSCDTCKREIEIAQDSLRPFLDKCNITYKCSGRLKLTGETSVRSQFKTPPAANIIDWVPRGTVTELVQQINVVQKPPAISLLTSDSTMTIGLD